MGFKVEVKQPEERELTEAEIQKDEEMRAKLAYERLSAVQKLFHHIKESRAKAYKLLVHYGPPYKEEYGGVLYEDCNDPKVSLMDVSAEWNSQEHFLDGRRETAFNFERNR